MKNFNKLLVYLVCCFAALLAVSCQKSNNEPAATSPELEINVDGTITFFSVLKASKTLNLTSSVPWTITISTTRSGDAAASNSMAQTVLSAKIRTQEITKGHNSSGSPLIMSSVEIVPRQNSMDNDDQAAYAVSATKSSPYWLSVSLDSGTAGTYSLPSPPRKMQPLRTGLYI